MKLDIGFVGYGVVGSSLGACMDRNLVNCHIVDPAYGEDSYRVEDLVDCQYIFICLPCPTTNLWTVDASDLYETMETLLEIDYKGMVVLKSTVTSDIIEKCQSYASESNFRFVFCPEFLVEATPIATTRFPHILVFGGTVGDCQNLFEFFEDFTDIDCSVNVNFTTARNASLIKYFVNSFLATKVMFMNQWKEAFFSDSDRSGEWRDFLWIVEEEPRIGGSHLEVPGPDGKHGFGGKCFPKDTKAIVAHDQTVSLSLIRTAIEANKKVRDDV